MARADDFLIEDNWSGSYYELAMQLGPQDHDRADERLRSAGRVDASGSVVRTP